MAIFLVFTELMLLQIQVFWDVILRHCASSSRRTEGTQGQAINCREILAPQKQRQISEGLNPQNNLYQN
jgi:hypothetical protein